MEGNRQRAPTLYGIITVKLIKGALFAIFSMVAYAYSDNNLPDEYRHLLHWLHVNPERQFWVYLAAIVSNLTENNLLTVAVATFIYGAFSLVEGIGLVFRVSWASWMAIGESGLFIPLEIYELNLRFSRTVVVILILNLIIFWYLLLNRKRLFHPAHLHLRHHLQPAPPPTPAVSPPLPSGVGAADLRPPPAATGRSTHPPAQNEGDQEQRQEKRE
jgi:uncharacterized membrane protein (DUF2068 family)